VLAGSKDLATRKVAKRIKSPFGLKRLPMELFVLFDNLIQSQILAIDWGDLAEQARSPQIGVTQ